MQQSALSLPESPALCANSQKSSTQGPGNNRISLVNSSDEPEPESDVNETNGTNETVAMDVEGEEEDVNTTNSTENKLNASNTSSDGSSGDENPERSKGSGKYTNTDYFEPEKTSKQEVSGGQTVAECENC